VLKPADYTRWKRKNPWRLHEAVALMLGIEPNQEIQEDDQVYSDYWDMLETAVRSERGERKDLPTKGRTQVNRYVEIYASVNQADFLKWAKRKEYNIPNELTDILDNRKSEHAVQEKIMIPIVTPKSKDDWFHVIRDAVLAFQNRNGYTPSNPKLWSVLIKSPPDDYGIAFDNKCLTLPDGNSMDRENFNKRYNRYFPANKS